MSLYKENMFGLLLDIGEMDDFILATDKMIRKKKSAHIVGVNADKINQMSKDNHLEEIVERADVIHPDGISMVIASRILNKISIKRIAGIDLMLELLKLSQSKNYKVYFLGSKDEVLKEMISNISLKYPNLNIVGRMNGYFSDDEWENIAKNLKILKPDLVFVGITSPKKEYLIDYMITNKINSTFIGVGGSFDVLSGMKKRAPLWMQKTGLEWLFRLIQEPKRLFLRYFLGNLVFFKLILSEKLGIDSLGGGRQ